jgi:hypothetical protein
LVFVLGQGWSCVLGSEVEADGLQDHKRGAGGESLNIRGDLADGPPQVVADGRGAPDSATPSRVVRNADWQVRSVTRLRFRSTRAT